jgi:hypothetical protein
VTKFSDAALSWLGNILQERFGHVFILVHESSGLMLTLSAIGQGSILFPKLQAAFHEPLANIPCTAWDAVQEGWISILEKPLPAPGASDLTKPLIEHQLGQAVIHYDILGLTYWMLNRIEEIDRSDLDIHGRFPAINSHAYKHGYLERPVVDEWLEILGQVIEKQWPFLEVRRGEFSIAVSHDVDAPSQYSFCTWSRLFKSMMGDVLKRGDMKRAFLAPWIKINNGKKIHLKDNYNTFSWIMEQSESRGIKSAFYFICGRTDVLMDSDYEIDHPAICNLIDEIYSRGHEIGLHPSYNSFMNPVQIELEASRLRGLCFSRQIKQKVFGGRMHYLRWSHPATLQAWDDAGMGYDSSLGFADYVGFRCGTCYEYQGFNPVSQITLSIRIRPLIAMECTIIADRYMGLGYTPEAKMKFLELKETCRKVGGVFTLLWHNSNLGKKDKKLYREIL